MSGGERSWDTPWPPCSKLLFGAGCHRESLERQSRQLREVDDDSSLTRLPRQPEVAQPACLQTPR